VNSLLANSSKYFAVPQLLANTIVVLLGELFSILTISAKIEEENVVWDPPCNNMDRSDFSQIGYRPKLITSAL